MKLQLLRLYSTIVNSAALQPGAENKQKCFTSINKHSLANSCEKNGLILFVVLLVVLLFQLRTIVRLVSRRHNGGPGSVRRRHLLSVLRPVITDNTPVSYHTAGVTPP